MTERSVGYRGRYVPADDRDDRWVHHVGPGSGRRRFTHWNGGRGPADRSGGD